MSRSDEDTDRCGCGKPDYCTPRCPDPEESGPSVWAAALAKTIANEWIIQDIVLGSGQQISKLRRDIAQALDIAYRRGIQFGSASRRGENHGE